MVLYDPFKIKVDVGLLQLLLRVFIATSHLIKNPSIPSWKAMTIGRCLFVCLFVCLIDPIHLMHQKTMVEDMRHLQI